MLKKGRVFIGRLNCNDDLSGALTAFCTKNNIKAGVFQLIGAVQNATIGYYDQAGKKYGKPIRINKELEIISCSGNISIKDGKIFVHAHIVLSDEKGAAFGGHLLSGTRVFAAEYYIQEITGTALVRVPDSKTGLSLWK